MPFVDVDQLSTDWLKMRCGSITASHLAEVMDFKVKPDKAGNRVETQARANYRKRKIREYFSGLNTENYVSPYMDRGIEIEPLAKAAYEIENDCEVLHGGLFVHDGITHFMASPDGRIGDDGLIEIKYLTGFTTEANHLDLLDGADVPEEYQLQIYGQQACAPERKWTDFISFDPDLPKHIRMFKRRFPRDEAKIEQIEREVCTFLLEMVAQLKRYYKYLPGSGDDMSKKIEASVKHLEAAQ